MDDKRALRSQIRKEIELFNAQQGRIDDEYRSAVQKYKSQSSPIQARKKDAWIRLCAITGINTLPDELLLDIMQRVVWHLHGWPYAPQKRLPQLQRVCKRWMALCVGTAAFWTKFELLLPTDRHNNIGLYVHRLENGFPKAVTRSKGLPISLTVRPHNMDDYHPGLPRSLLDRPVSPQNAEDHPTILRKMFEIIRPSEVHIQSLTLHLTEDVDMMVADTLWKQFSRLEDLALVGELLPGSWRFPLALRTTTLKRLRAKHLRIIALDLPSSLSGLENLHFDHSTLLEGRRAEEESVEEWIYWNGEDQDDPVFVLDAAVLQTLPNLRSLHIQLEARMFSLSDAVYLLRELRSLSVECWAWDSRTVEMEVAPFFQHVQLPTLQSLHVVNQLGRDSDTADQIIDTLRPVVAGVTSIALHRIIPSPGHLKTLLLRANDLEELDIGGGEISAELMRVLGDPMLKNLHTIKFTDIEKRSFAILEEMLSQGTEEASQLSRRVRIWVQSYMSDD
ncbi:hypothetical protein CALVIDRAFT_535276 [Calocera viscosa TUFC12733]|uniref:F-box domain-containing protein n=1 Tax=Calocera viscosa (strain TUFC12733) TaxID=1330018 RepID=A0A167PDI8_CALVF|nr:hypothetical protein CALVIDRAFT_535276 [Calocera viscosa TUFC12733]